MFHRFAQGMTSFLRSPSVYPFLVGCLGFYALVRLPIVRTDTDLWFHLDYGRYLFQHRVIPHSTFFSFISPPIEIVDHPWLFQAVVYLLHSWWGYYGLIALRGAAYLATVLLVFRYLVTPTPAVVGGGTGSARSQPLWWPGFIATLCSLALISRYFNVRPHIFTLFFIPAFLSIIELRPQRAGWLPLLAILWVNLHGITYPVMLLVTMAYSLEYLWDRLRGRALPGQIDRRVFVSAVLSMAAIYLTPHGLRLLPLPFLPLTYDSQYVQELLPLSPGALLSVAISAMTPSPGTIVNLLFLAACFAALTAVWTNTLRVSHLLLALGACVLLSKGNRFTYEAILLLLPLLKAHPPVRPGALTQRLPPPVSFVGIGMLLLMPLMLLRPACLRPRPSYPISYHDLPHGVDVFLKHLDAGGTLMNDPNGGGYHRWMLSPRYTIFVDMEFPGIPIEYFHRSIHAFQEGESLRRVLTRYDPSFLTAPITAGRFRQLIQRFPDYVMVFFDDAEVLYANRRQVPAVAKHYELRGMNPFELDRQHMEALLSDDTTKVAALIQVRSMLDVYPDGLTTNHLVALAYHDEGSYDRSLPYAEAIVRNAPESPIGYHLMGDSLKGLHADEQAMPYYRKALERANVEERRTIWGAIGSIELEGHRYQRAYEALKRSCDVFSPTVTLKDLYRLASSAVLAGHIKDAESILQFMYSFRIAPEDPEWADKVKREMIRLGADVEH